MSYGEEILKLRKRVADAVSHSVFNMDNKDIIEALLIQVMNDAERNRQQCISQAENLRKQAFTLDGQAGAFASMGSIVYNVINGFVMKAEHSEKEAEVMKKDKEGIIPDETVKVSKRKSKK